MLESISEYLSQKYSYSSLDNPDHYKTIIIQKIVRMFHTLDEMTKKSEDEVSARCVLRGILDNVTTYCFIYEREDQSDIMFRHYLYELDGFTTYKIAIIDGILEEGINKLQFEYSCNAIISQIKQKIMSHPYYKLDKSNVDTIIINNNWKYESLDKPISLTFHRMYRQILLDEKLVNYYSDILCQYSHGLCLSNIPCVNHEQIQKVLFESIPLADRMVKGICRTFPQKEILKHFYLSDSFKKIISCHGFNHDELFEFAKAIIMKDKTMCI